MIPHKAERAVELSAGWVSQTLRQRGLPVPLPVAVKKGIALLDDDERKDFKQKITRIAAGAEQAGEMDWMADWSRKQTASRPDIAELSANDSPPPTRVQADSEQPRTFEPSHHVYGAKGVLCFECVKVEPEGDRHHAYFTVQIDAAPAATKGRFDWDKKTVFRLTRRELGVVAAAMLGWCPMVNLIGHGPLNDKRLDIEDQGGVMFVKLSQGRRTVAVPIGADEICEVSAMLLKAIGRNQPELDSQTVLHLVKRAGAMMTAAHEMAGGRAG
jgi:hypothetical protein